ncbi:hypothetical protein [Clostridium sp.]|uniref:hypothetical protein n=1 Tax=Clostridium sp. TaxID=1506 RepID=UPI0026277920|nr:hypothetical protein [Clostridium sp.]
MLKLTWIEFFLRALPEISIMVWGIRVISGKCIDMPKYIFSSVILSILIFFVRWLPIYFGVHIMINIILMISIMAIIGIQIIKAMYSTLLMFFTLSLGEFLNMILLNLLNINTSIQFINPFIKCIYNLPSLIFLLLSIIIINYLLNNEVRMKKCI